MDPKSAPPPTASTGTHPSVSTSPEEVAARGMQFFKQYPRDTLLWRLFSRLTVLSVGLIGKIFVKLWHRTSVRHIHHLNEAIERARREKRGVVTVMNHISVLDDPLVWGATLPVGTLARMHRMRWALGARDICFKNRAEALFFSLGQVLSVERFGRGPDQPALDCAVTLLSAGRWVHLYPEGFVHQPHEPYAGTLRYFHWGVSRLVLEPGPKAPLVVPIYATGLQNVFPEDKVKKTFGYGRNIPLLYTFGKALDPQKIEAYRQQWAAAADDAARQDLRSEVASFVRNSVLETKREGVRLLEQDQDPRLGSAEFWKNQTLVKLKGLSMHKKKEKKKRLG